MLSKEGERLVSDLENNLVNIVWAGQQYDFIVNAKASAIYATILVSLC